MTDVAPGLEDVFTYLDEHEDEGVKLLTRLCSQPSISAVREGLADMAGLLSEEMGKLGIDVRLEDTSTGVQVVVGSIEVDDALPTLLFYNHYDVQPVDPLDEWVTPPFEPAVRDGHLYARGATDNKGNIVSRLAAIAAHRAVGRPLPCNVKFMIEGQEEIGSPGFADFVERRSDMLRADACVWEDAMGRIDEPVVSLGSKGMCHLELRAKVANVDAHSAYATVFPNAAWRLIWALAALKGEDERVRVPGFYESVRPLDENERSMLDRLIPLDSAQLRAERGFRRLLLDVEGRDIHARRTLEPTCNVAGIVGGYIGEGTKTVLPAEARALIDLRLVPDQEPQEVFEAVKRHLTDLGFDDVEVVFVGGSLPSRTPLDSPLNRAIARASRAAYDKDAIFEPHNAGSTPQWIVGRHLGIPCSATGVGYVTADPHAPNEKIDLGHLRDGTRFMAAIMEEFGRESH